MTAEKGFSRRRIRIIASCLCAALMVPSAICYNSNHVARRRKLPVGISNLRVRCPQENICFHGSFKVFSFGKYRLERSTALFAIDVKESETELENLGLNEKSENLNITQVSRATPLNRRSIRNNIDAKSVYFASLVEPSEIRANNDAKGAGGRLNLNPFAFVSNQDADKSVKRTRNKNDSIASQERIRVPVSALLDLFRTGQQDDSSNTTENDQASTNTTFGETRNLSLRRLWRRRHARTLEEGIRREKATELSDLLNRAQIDARPDSKRYVERTLMGLINALTEEVEDLDIELTTKRRTPVWRKEVKEVRINFSRLGFKQLQMGGSDKYDRQGNAVVKETLKEEDDALSLVQSADEAFDRIDKDKSGTLDEEEIAKALGMISELETNKESIQDLAAELVILYDLNSDGVVDREEYQLMVEDMAKLRASVDAEEVSKKSPLKKVKDSVQTFSRGISERAAKVAAAASGSSTVDFDPNEREMGSIVLSDLKLDLRRLVFGGVPMLKRLTPGGPLILEPFTATVRGSFTSEDVMGSFLLDAGLRLLVARAIRVRVRSFRDVVDGAYFFGRRWKMASKTAPVVQVLGLSNIEFRGDKMILTGRARIRTSPDAPVVTNTFKVRTKIGTGNNGQTIGLREPELAFVFECPQAWENGIGVVCEQLGMTPPKRPEPLYSFFPIYSPFKVNEQAGFDMGEDNKLRKIFIKDGKLRFEMRSVLRPGRFLGSHYLAFTVPMRTFIITMDRVKEGIRVARKNKKIAVLEKKLILDAQGDASGRTTRDLSGRRVLSSIRKFASRPRIFATSFPRKPKQSKPKSFFTRFVEGYTLVEREGEAKNEQLTNEISDWFGRQGQNNETIADDG